MKIWLSTSKHPCPSCAALHGQIHSEKDWTIQPADAALYCGEHCSCQMQEIDAEEQGDLSSVPLRQMLNRTGTGAASTPLSTIKTERTQAMQEQDITLQLQATPTREGFDILAINAGEAKGHGIIFGRDVLMQAVSMYEARPVFIDHAGLGNAPSVRDLAGTIQMSAWDEAQTGIRAKLIPAGPAADVLLAIRDAAKTNAAVMQAVGFSTVLNVQLDKQGNVTKIVRVKSVDVVIDPARGGRFLSANLGQKGVNNMSEETITTEDGAQSETTSAANQLQANRQATAELLGEQARIQAMDAQLQASNDVLVATCEHLLTAGLAGSRLPEIVQKRIRKQFNGKAFKAPELQAAITEAREELAALSEQNVQGPGRQVYGMFNSADQFRLAVEDMFGLERSPAQANIKVHRLMGIRDAYLKATGDEYFMGGFFPEFALVSANFPGIVANVQNKMLIDAWKDFEESYGWWQKIVTIEHFTNLKTATWVRTGTIASLPSVAERGEYTELPIGDIKETSEWGKYGGYVPLTIEAVINDDLRAFRRMPSEVALAGIRNISEQVAAIFTTNSAAGPVMTDGGALFNATAQTTAGGHINLLTTALGTDYTAWNAVALAMYKKKLMVKNASGSYGTGKPQALKPSICLVPADLITAAEALFIPRWDAPAQNVPATASIRWGGRVQPIAVPEWTDATDWAALIDPKLRPGIMLGEIFGVKPQIFSASSETDAAMFANDESRIKVRQFVTVGVADDLPLHKSNVGG